MKRLICLLLVLTLPALALAEGTQKVFFEDETKAFPEDAELLTLRVCPLLGADCMLLTLGEHSMLVDTGRKMQAGTVLEVLKEAGLTSVEYVFSTHPHQDHLGGMIPMLEAGLDVGTFFTVFPHDYVEFIGDYEVQPETIKALEAKGIPVADLKPDDTIPFGNAEITVLRIPDSSIGTSARTCNDMSAMLMVKYGDCSVLLTADVERMDEIELAELYDLKADILKYPHHGMSVIEPVFLDEIRPEFVFFTHGAGDTHNAQVQIYQAGYERMCFATWGTITMRTDGTKWIVKQEILPEYTEIAERYVYGK